MEQGTLTATKTLVLDSTKRILLDSSTAPTPQYTQMYKDTSGIRYLTLLNTYTNSIYFYDYTTLNYVKQIVLDKKGPDGILKPMGYYIKSIDSIYVYNMVLPEVVLINSAGKVVDKKSLRGEDKAEEWYEKYPQYVPETVTPFIKYKGKLFLTGQSVTSLPSTSIDKFKFTAMMDIGRKEIDFIHNYPEELYGNDYNWYGDLYTKVYPALHPDGDKLIYSFPVSHDLYMMDINGDSSKKVYAGSNEAGTISSIPKEVNKVSSENLYEHYASQDLYTAIIYDKYRNLYYRFITRAIPNANEHHRPKDKPIGIIIMDAEFKYLGEVTLGTGHQWYWQNSFVTKEGLNIEYLDHEDIDEIYLTLKIFTLKDLKDKQA